jgi:hypothetical protein
MPSLPLLVASQFNYNFQYHPDPLVSGISGLIGILIYVAICYLISDALASVPIEHRRGMSPGLVWLLLIPLFNLVWNFFVFPRVSDSFRSYFDSTGRPIPGDYGRQLGIAFAILNACMFIPCLNCLAFIPCLVLLIILLVKFTSYKNAIRQGGGGAFPMQ